MFGELTRWMKQIKKFLEGTNWDVKKGKIQMNCKKKSTNEKYTNFMN